MKRTLFCFLSSVVLLSIPALSQTEVTTCQPDIGYGGPGDSVLSLCGGDLSTGTTADLRLTGGGPTAWMILVVGRVSNPIPFKGGLLVPSPPMFLGVFHLDGNGDWLLPNIPGGGGPATWHAQAISTSRTLPLGIEISNCLRINRLP